MAAELVDWMAVATAVCWVDWMVDETDERLARSELR